MVSASVKRPSRHQSPLGIAILIQGAAALKVVATWGMLEIAKTVKIEMIIENSIIMFPFAEHKFKDFSGKTPQCVSRILFEILHGLFFLETRILRLDYL